MRRLLVAICLHDDDEGLVCTAGDRELADATGVGADLIAATLEGLRAGGWVDVLDGRDGADRRIVLMDHEAAGWYAAETRKAMGKLQG